MHPKTISPNFIFSELLKGNYHKGGLKCLRLFKVKVDFFNALKNEVVNLIETYHPSKVKKGHVTNWTNPYGNAIQFSLLNRSGRFDDTSDDHTRKLEEGKAFHHPASYPTLATFIKAFPHAYNMRINGLMNNSGLSPHEEHIVECYKRGFPQNTYHLRARFHLPIITNNRSEMLLDNDFYKFEVGAIFLFNNGCIHAASNYGSEARYHLVWDMLLTRKTFELMFLSSDNSIPSFLEKVFGDEQIVNPHRNENIKEYAIMGEGKILYNQWKLAKLGVKPYQFQNWFNEYEYLNRRIFGKVEFIPFD